MIQTIHELTANITQTPTQHGYKVQHSTVNALHTLKQTIIIVLDMSKAFDTVNTDTLIGLAATEQHPWYDYKVCCKLHQKTQSLYYLKKHKSIQRQVKAGVPQGGVLSPNLFHNRYSRGYRTGTSNVICR